MKRFFTRIVLFFLLPLPIYSQGDADLYRFSKTRLYGGARFEAMGGSFGSLGADLAASQINPAGFGRYSRSQVLGSMGYSFLENSTTFKNQLSGTQNNLFNMNNAGVLLVNDDSKSQSGFLYTQVGLGYNRVQNFRSNVHYEGQQYESLLEDFADKGKGYTPDELFYFLPFSTSMAYETYTINPDGNNGYYADLSPGDMYHQRDIKTRGGTNEFYLSLSSNYMNKLYLGANLGLRTTRYSEETNHNERLLDTSGTQLRSFDYTYNLRTEGSGGNIKIGVIYLPIDQLRLGFAIHSPTFYEMTDKYSANMVAYFEDTTRTLPESYKPSGEYKYRLRTPSKMIGSIAYILGTKGCINADIEYINYKWAHLRSTEDENYAKYDFVQENKFARSVLTSGLNARIGMELVFNAVFFVRGGIGIQTQAYNKKANVENGNDTSVSFGIGYKWGSFALDASFRRDWYSRNYVAFYNSTARIDSQVTGITLSLTYLLNN